MPLQEIMGENSITCHESKVKKPFVFLSLVECVIFVLTLCKCHISNVQEYLQVHSAWPRSAFFLVPFSTKVRLGVLGTTLP